jgi:hypothetical protein
MRHKRRAAARERVLSRLGSELLRATDPAEIRRAAVDAAVRLLGATGGRA